LTPRVVTFRRPPRPKDKLELVLWEGSITRMFNEPEHETVFAKMEARVLEERISRGDAVNR